MSVFESVMRVDARDPLGRAPEQSRSAARSPGEVEEFDRVVDAYQARVYGFVRRMVATDEEAQDATQEVFVRAFQGFARFDGRCSLRTWLFRIAHNYCVDLGRRRAGAAPEVRIDSSGADGSVWEFADQRWHPEDRVLSLELAEVVEEGLRTMSEKLRSVLLLHDREELTYDEIAEAVGIPIGTVKSRLFLARAHLQGHIRKYQAAREER